jgi:predicted transcriptional regulator
MPQLSLGPLEAEILDLVWDLSAATGSTTAKVVRERLLADPDRELAYASVMTVLRRLMEKGWLLCDRSDRAFTWRPALSRQEATALRAYDRLQAFLDVGNPDIVAAFADRLDAASADRLEAIAQRIRTARQNAPHPNTTEPNKE